MGMMVICISRRSGYNKDTMYKHYNLKGIRNAYTYINPLWFFAFCRWAPAWQLDAEC